MVDVSLARVSVWDIFKVDEKEYARLLGGRSDGSDGRRMGE